MCEIAASSTSTSGSQLRPTRDEPPRTVQLPPTDRTRPRLSPPCRARQISERGPEAAGRTLLLLSSPPFLCGPSPLPPSPKFINATLSEVPFHSSSRLILLPLLRPPLPPAHDPHDLFTPPMSLPAAFISGSYQSASSVIDAFEACSSRYLSLLVRASSPPYLSRPPCADAALGLCLRLRQLLLRPQRRSRRRSCHQRAGRRRRRRG